MRTTRRLAALAVAATLLTACGQDAPTPTPTEAATATPAPSATSAPSLPPTPTASGDADPDTPEGWQRITVDQDGFSIAVPGGWGEMSADVLADEAFLDDLEEANPGAAEALQQGRAALESGQIALFAFDPDVGTAGFATNLNVINVGPVSESVEEAAEGVAAAIEEQIPVTGPVEVETTRLPAGDAAVVRYAWEVAGPGSEPTPVTVMQYAILSASGTGFIVSMSAATDDIDRQEATFRQIAESFRESGQ